MHNLPDANEQLQAIFRAFPDLLFVLDSQGTILDYKSGDTRIFDQPQDALIGQHVTDILPGDVGTRFQDALLRAQESRQTVSIDFSIQAQRKQLWFEARFVGLPHEHFAAFVRDITERKVNELTIRRQLDRLSALRAVDMAITSSLDLRLTLSILVNQVKAQLGVNAARILLTDPETGALRFAAGDGFRTSMLQVTSLKQTEGHAERAASTRQLVRVTNLARGNPEFLSSPYLEQEGFVDYFAVPLIAKARVLGVLEVFHRTPLAPGPEWLDFLEMLAGQAAIAVESAVMLNNVERTNAALTLAYDATIEGWSRALDLREREPEGHTQRVTELTIRLASMVGVPDQQIVHIRRGAVLHDIGKMALPDGILFKPGPLDDDEWHLMRQHTSIAVELLSPITYLGPALEIPEFHHERWDGTGYPHGLHEEEIPLAARLFAVVDVYDSVTSPRPYRGAWTRDQAMVYIQAESGRHFDPKVVGTFISMMEQQVHP